jgi:hypothetical protein
MLGITSLGDAARFGLRPAELQTTAKHFAGPTDAALAAAVRHATQSAKLAPFTIAQAALSKDAVAYPATMVVYTAARTANLPKADAAKVASFIRTATTEGQKPGPGNGQLPGGYLPIRSTGATQALFAAASQVADAVAAQKGAASTATTTDEQKPATTGAPRGAGAGGGSAPAVGGLPDSSPASTTPAGTVSTKPVKAAAAGTPRQVASSIPTTAETSQVARTLIPLLLFVGLLAGLGSAVVRTINARGRS